MQTIYTRVHEGCTRLSIGLCTVHDIIVELRARLYDIRGGSVHSTRHYCRIRCTDKILHMIRQDVI